MKVKAHLVFLLIFLVIVSFFAASNYLNNPLPVVTEDSRELMVEDALIKMLFPYIIEAVEDYYGTPKQFSKAKIVEIKRLDKGQYYFNITIQVVTYEGPHNPPYGTEIITIMLDNKIFVADYEHKDGFPSSE